MGKTKTFYFTYGIEEQPYVGGWTEIVAEDLATACAAFRAYHPDRTPGLLNCAIVYDEENFKKTCMYENGSNLGATCHERIFISREIAGGDKS